MHRLIASARCFVQAIVALKKGSHLLKCGKRGKPKFCAFRLSSVSNLVPAISLQQILEPVSFDRGTPLLSMISVSSYLFPFYLHTTPSLLRGA